MQLPVSPDSRRFEQWVLFTAVLGMLMMPVEYRGGAELSHPHAGLQLVSEAATGSLSHHHDGVHHQQLPPGAPDGSAYRLPGDQETPSLTTAPFMQKYAPFAIVGPAGFFVLLRRDGSSPARRRQQVVQGVPQAPSTPPPRLSPGV